MVVVEVMKYDILEFYFCVLIQDHHTQSILIGAEDHGWSVR